MIVVLTLGAPLGEGNGFAFAEGHSPTPTPKVIDHMAVYRSYTPLGVDERPPAPRDLRWSKTRSEAVRTWLAVAQLTVGLVAMTLVLLR